MARMDLLNEYVEDIGIDPELATELRDYFDQCVGHHRAAYHRQLLNDMTPTLRGAVACHLHSAWCRQIWFLNADDVVERNRFITAIAVALVPMAFAADELIYDVLDLSDAMYVVRRGLIGQGGAPLGVGRFFGEDCLLGVTGGVAAAATATGATSCHTRRSAARALIFCELNCLPSDEVVRILATGRYPQTMTLIRRNNTTSKLQQTLTQVVHAMRLSKGYVKLSAKDFEYWKKELRVRGADKGERAKRIAAEALMQPLQREARLAVLMEEINCTLQVLAKANKHERAAIAAFPTPPLPPEQAALAALGTQLAEVRGEVAALAAGVDAKVAALDARLGAGLDEIMALLRDAGGARRLAPLPVLATSDSDPPATP